MTHNPKQRIGKRLKPAKDAPIPLPPAAQRREPRYWMGDAPAQCDICNGGFASVMYDARTKSGQWGNICRKCFSAYGVGIGMGRGQRYELTADGRWLKTGG
jgi:hypothetical protein